MARMIFVTLLFFNMASCYSIVSEKDQIKVLLLSKYDIFAALSLLTGTAFLAETWALAD